MEDEISFDDGQQECGSGIDFSNGELSAYCYSYEIDSTGEFHLNERKTYKLFLAMKKYYEKT